MSLLMMVSVQTVQDAIYSDSEIQNKKLGVVKMEKLMTIEKTSSLQRLTVLSESVTIYVPSTFNVTTIINPIKYINYICENLSALFGGATATDGAGYWVTDDKEDLIKESVTLVKAFSGKLSNEDIDSVIDLCSWLKTEMKQECISLEINGKLYFV